MITFEPGKDRWKLGFKEAVLDNFNFLEDYGLKCDQADATFVRYDSPKVFMNIYHGRGSYELNLEIGRHNGAKKDSTHNLDAVLEWYKAPEQKLLDLIHPLFQSHTREGVQEMVPKMAALFRKYAEPLLRSDEEAFKSFEAYCIIASIRLGERFTNGTTRWKAGRAFDCKDWKQAVNSYEMLGDDLSQIEKAELAYAKEQLRLQNSPTDDSAAIVGNKIS